MQNYKLKTDPLTSRRLREHRDEIKRKIKIYSGRLRPGSKSFIVFMYSWFSHDVTKMQTKKLSILPRFYFHDALEQLKTNFHTNFRFKRILGFVIEYA